MFLIGLGSSATMYRFHHLPTCDLIVIGPSNPCTMAFYLKQCQEAALKIHHLLLKWMKQLIAWSHYRPLSMMLPFPNSRALFFSSLFIWRPFPHMSLLVLTDIPQCPQCTTLACFKLCTYSYFKFSVNIDMSTKSLKISGSRQRFHLWNHNSSKGCSLWALKSSEIYCFWSYQSSKWFNLWPHKSSK